VRVADDDTFQFHLDGHGSPRFLGSLDDGKHYSKKSWRGLLAAIDLMRYVCTDTGDRKWPRTLRSSSLGPNRHWHL
jgi:hypothetical protein